VTLAVTEQERVTIIRPYQTGFSVAEVSERTGPSTTWIRQYLQRSGMLARSRSHAVALSGVVATPRPPW
jgi:hypothetical protein